MFSDATKLAMIVYTFSYVPQEQQRWFLSRFPSLKLYFPIMHCQDTDLDANGDGIYLAIQKHHLDILEQECVTDRVVYMTGCDFVESLAVSDLPTVKVDHMFEIVPALVGENKRKHWWQ